MNHLRHAFRLISRNPGFAAAVIGSLALGVGGVTAIFSVLDAVLLRPLPYHNPERLVVIWENDRIRGTAREQASTPDYLDIRAQAKSFEHLEAWNARDVTLSGEGEPRRVAAARVTDSYFSALGVPAPALTPKNPNTALISRQLWRSYFRADPNIVGRAFTLDGQPYTVIGVLPPEATLPYQTDQLWIPYAAIPNDQYRGIHNSRIYARLKRGVSVEQAQAEVTGIMARLERQYKDDNEGRGAVVVPLHQQVTGALQRPLYVLIGAVGLLLLIACANVAGLLLARASARHRDYLIRAAIGATQGQLFRQALFDNFVLVALGSTTGLLLAVWMLDLVRAAPLSMIPRLTTVSLDARVAVVALAACALAWVLVSLPMHRRFALGVATREAVLDRLVIAEIALSVLLLSGAGLLIRSAWALASVEPGFNPRNLASLALQLPQSRYPAPKSWPFRTWPEVTSLRTALIEKLKQLPGVTDAAVSLYSPASGGWTTRMTIAGRPAPPAGQQDEMHFRPVSHEYFRTAGLGIRRGRAFTNTDDEHHPQVAIINEAFARRYFPGGNPIGQAVNIYGTWREIVGVAGEERFMGVVNPSPPAAYLPLEQFPQPSLTILVRSKQDPALLFRSIERQVWSIDPALALYDVRTVEDELAASMLQGRLLLGLLGSFAFVALSLAALGIYGVVSFAVSSRTREIGVRMAFGARPAGVLARVLRDGASLSLAGAALGLAGALVLTRFLSTLLYEVSPHDPLTLVAVPSLAMLASLVAGLHPAVRAARIDPMEALRHD
jgi:putative ABC transport system permease protein